MKTHHNFFMFAFSLLIVFFTQTSAASEIKFVHVKLTLLSDGETLMDPQFVFEIGKTVMLHLRKKNDAGLATTYRADFAIENTMVNELGNAVGTSSLRVFKLDNDKKRWVLEREQKVIARLNGSTAKTSLHSSRDGTPHVETFLSISPITEAEVLLKYGRTSAQNACTAETMTPNKSLKLTTKSFFDDCPTLDDCVKGPDCCSIQCSNGGWLSCCGATTCFLCDTSCSP
jgi:hypothetical protein